MIFSCFRTFTSKHKTISKVGRNINLAKADKTINFRVRIWGINLTLFRFKEQDGEQDSHYHTPILSPQRAEKLISIIIMSVPLSMLFMLLSRTSLFHPNVVYITFPLRNFTTANRDRRNNMNDIYSSAIVDVSGKVWN
jgi:hypothetical protein